MNIKEFLKYTVTLREQMKKPPGFAVNSMEEFTLKYGRTYAPVTPGEYKAFAERLHLPWRRQFCFSNAAQLAFEFPSEFVYCEGYATAFFPVNHAWLIVKATGRVLDVTWDYSPEHEYIGVPFKAEFMRKHLLAKGTYGLLDDWQNDWPLLSIKFNPKEAIHEWNAHKIKRGRDPRSLGKGKLFP